MQRAHALHNEQELSICRPLRRKVPLPDDEETGLGDRLGLGAGKGGVLLVVVFEPCANFGARRSRAHVPGVRGKRREHRERHGTSKHESRAAQKQNED
eukprot:12657217-Prorocentrum_lima.AAC.1